MKRSEARRLLKTFDEDYKRFESMRHVLMEIYNSSKVRPLTERQTNTVLVKFDEFKALTKTMINRYQNIRLNVGFVDWLNDIDDFI